MANGEAVVALDTVLARYGVDPKDVMISLGVTYEAVRLWRLGRKSIGPKSAQEIARKFLIPLHEMRPDLWPPPPAPKGRQASAQSDEVNRTSLNPNTISSSAPGGTNE